MYTAVLLRQFKVHWENPTCVYYLGAALSGHLWEVSGTEDMGVGGLHRCNPEEKAMKPSRVWLCRLSEVNLAENRSGNSNKGNVAPALETN